MSKTSLVLLGLLAGAMSLPSSFAAANSLGAAGGINARANAATHKVAGTTTATTAAQKKKMAALKKKKLQQQQAAAKAKKAQQAKALQEQQKKKEWYESDRDRGLDIASEYAPDTIARIRKKNYIAKGDTVGTGNGKKGWQHYMDKYYSR